MPSNQTRTIAKLAFTTAVGLFTLGSAQAATTLKLAHFAAESHPAHTAALQLKKNVESRTGGELKIELFPANQLGSPPDQLEQTTVGVIDMNLPTQGSLDKYEKAFATVMTPFQTTPMHTVCWTAPSTTGWHRGWRRKGWCCCPPANMVFATSPIQNARSTTPKT